MGSVGGDDKTAGRTANLAGDPGGFLCDRTGDRRQKTDLGTICAKDRTVGNLRKKQCDFCDRRLAGT